MALSSIIPAINAQTKDEAENYIRIASGFTNFLHLDVADGKFTTHTTWGNPKEFRALIEKNGWKDIGFEIHLMVENPEAHVVPWSGMGAKRIIVHAEAVGNRESIIDQSSRKIPTIMVAIGPESPISLLLPYVSTVEAFQILAVVPGKAGQAFDAQAFDKIRELREKAPRAIIEVDGGVNPKTARMCRFQGANLFVSASHIFHHTNPASAFKELEEAVTLRIR